MRRWIWSLILVLIIASALSLAVFFVLTAGSPFDPADGWFYRSQRSLEEMVVRLRPNPESRAVLRIDMAGRRLRALERLQGGAQKAAALAELDQALHEAVQAVSTSPQTEASRLRADLLTLFEQTGRILTAGSPGTEELQQWMAGVTQRLRQPGLQLVDLAAPKTDISAVAVDQSLAAEPVPTPASQVSPLIIYFQSGSAGAQHTFYPLVGRHAEIQCIGCHPAGEFAGTGGLCETCHLTQKPASHFPGKCELCHAPTAWTDIHFQHFDPPANNCAMCHLRDRPAQHYPGQCSACHTTSAWLPASFNHAVAGVTNCLECHLANRPADHWDGQCSACHSTSGWLPASFNHAAAGATDCVACHSKNRPANHYNGQCSACHTTTGWLPATFNHSAAGATNCISCHLGRRPANHYDGQCSMCHSTRAWLPASFNHTFPTNHGGANGQCSTCHPSGTSSWTCFTCHNQGELDRKHNEEGIQNYASRCLSCHADGREGDD